MDSQQGDLYSRAAVREFVAYRQENLTPGRHAGLPSTTLTLVLPLDGKLDVSLAGTRASYTASLAGLHTTAATIHYGTEQIGYQLAIEPLACRAMFGVPAAELAHEVVELDALTGALAGRMLDAAGSAHSMPAGRAAVAALLPRLDADARNAESLGVRREIVGAWRLIQRSAGTTAVDTIADAVGWSRRHLEQEFRRELGITPKQACRLRRFERAVALVRDAHDLAESAALAGFADQPHLNREWRTFTGTSPTRWRRSERLAFVQDSARALRHSGNHD